MLISYNETDRLDLKILPGFKPVVKPAIKWKQLANGSYICVDRKEESDIYECEVSVYGRENDIDRLIRALEDNRLYMYSQANTFELSGFNSAEMIFGAEIDYSRPIKAMATKISDKKQKTWRGFSLKMILRALGVNTNNDIEAKFPNINTLNNNIDAPEAFLAIGSTGDSVIDMRKGDTYTGRPNFSDTRGDSGYFEGTFTLKTNDMASLRKFLIRENRGKVIEAGTPEGNIINAIPNLFGARRRGNANGNFNTRITEWADMGMKNLGFWQIKMKIVEEIPFNGGNG